MKLKFIIGVVGILSACGFTNAPSLDTTQEEQDNNWVIGPFHRPEGAGSCACSAWRFAASPENRRSCISLCSR